MGWHAFHSSMSEILRLENKWKSNISDVINIESNLGWLHKFARNCLLQIRIFLLCYSQGIRAMKNTFNLSESYCGAECLRSICNYGVIEYAYFPDFMSINNDEGVQVSFVTVPDGANTFQKTDMGDSHTNFTGSLYQITHRVLIFYNCVTKFIYKVWRNHRKALNVK